MKNKKIIMLNSIDDKLCLPVYELNNYMEYYKLNLASKENIKNNNNNLCYLLPCDTQIYEYLYKDKIIKLEYVVENVYLINNDYKEKILKYKNKFNN